MLPDPHPVLVCADTLQQALEDIADVPVTWMSSAEKADALVRVTEIGSRLDALRLRLIAASGQVAADDGARDVATWLTTRTRTDPGAERRAERLATALDTRWPVLAHALAEAAVTTAQAHTITRALGDRPDDLDPDTLAAAEARLVADAHTFGPHELRALGRRILDVIAPEIGEDHERRLLEAQEAAADRTTSLVRRRLGNGTSEVRIRCPDPVADRLITYLDAFTSPRHHSEGERGRRAATDTDPTSRSSDHGPRDRRLGQAFAALLEAYDPHRLPLHGGAATTLVITTTLDTLTEGLGVATYTTLAGQGALTPAQTRRLACTANLIPAVLGTRSEVLDLGRTTRLFTPAQRNALALRDTTCRAHDCTTPATWCEAHHRQPWSQGGPTDLDNALLLCRFHHQRIHDPRYHHTPDSNGTIKLHRRIQPASTDAHRRRPHDCDIIAGWR